MDNQHRHIKGYRELTPAEIDLMNRIKTHAQATQALVAEVGEHIVAQFKACEAKENLDAQDFEDSLKRTPEEQAEWQRLIHAEPHRWRMIANTDFQTGFMALTRAVAQPTTY